MCSTSLWRSHRRQWENGTPTHIYCSSSIEHSKWNVNAWSSCVYAKTMRDNNIAIVVVMANDQAHRWEKCERRRIAHFWTPVTLRKCRIEAGAPWEQTRCNAKKGRKRDVRGAYPTLFWLFLGHPENAYGYIKQFLLAKEQSLQLFESGFTTGLLG